MLDGYWFLIYFTGMVAVAIVMITAVKRCQRRGETRKAWLLTALAAAIVALHWTWPFLLMGGPR